MYKLANCWTKEKAMEQVKKYNNGQRCTSAYGHGCLYSNETGNRCAVGCFIPDGHKGLKSRGDAVSLIINFPELRQKMPFDEPGPLTAFQRAHDDSYLYTQGNTYEAIRIFLDKEVE
jgi:hypothetical protein